MTSGLIISHKQNENLFAKKLKNPSKSNIESFQSYNNIYSKLRRISKPLHYDEQFIKFTRNIKQTWSLIREVIGTNKQKDQIPNFFRCNGQTLTVSIISFPKLGQNLLLIYHHQMQTL